MAKRCTCNRGWTGPCNTVGDRAKRWLNAVVMQACAEKKLPGNIRADVIFLSARLAAEAVPYGNNLFSNEDGTQLIMPDGCPA